MKYQFMNRDSRLLCRPFGLLVDPCNGCNLACAGCVHSERSRSLNLFQWKSGMLPTDRPDAFFDVTAHAEFRPFSVTTVSRS
jgi:hypothetical protein